MIPLFLWFANSFCFQSRSSISSNYIIYKIKGAAMNRAKVSKIEPQPWGFPPHPTEAVVK